MRFRPLVDWPVAKAVAGRLQQVGLPEVTRPEAVAAVAAIRLAAERAGGLAVEFSHLPGAPATNIQVTDREGWTTGVAQMFDAALEQIPAPERPDGVRRRVGGLVYGLAGGAAVGMIGRHLLGQYDAFSPTQPLYLLAPNLVEHEKRRRLVPDDFRLWVAVHEQTHAVQFSAAPWLGEYLMERFVALVLDEPGPLDMVRGLAAGRGAKAVIATADGSRLLEEVQAAMALVEGHADFVSDAVGRVHIPTARRLRHVFSRTGQATLWERLLPDANKTAQYRDGLRFCKVVAGRIGARGLARAFTGPETLPTTAELADPHAWLRRMRGQA